MHKLHTVYTARISYTGDDATDITAKGDDPDWKYFAPSWGMVMGYKGGTISKENYVLMYKEKLKRVPVTVWGRFLSRETRTLLCYCDQVDFCHRNILVRHIISILGDRIHYGGFRN